MIIYRIRNKINNKVYIGQTVQTLNNRKTQHKHDSLRAKYPINFAIAKYGFDNFTFEIIHECKTLFDLNQMEKFYIWVYGSTNPKFGYNLQCGGSDNFYISNKTRKNMSKAQRLRFSRAEEKEKQSILMKKRFENPDEREKNINNYNTGNEKF